MTVLIAIPAYRLICNVGIDKGRAWSVVDELLLWAITRQSKTIGALASESKLPHQFVVASIARLMRFRLVEVALIDGGVAFRASEYGFKQVSSGNPLPFFPKRHPKRISFVIERATGDFFTTRDVRFLMSHYKLDKEKRAGADVRLVVVEDGNPPMSHEANFNRLSDIAAGGWNEEIGTIDHRTVELRDEYLVVRLIGGIPQGLPENASDGLKRIVAQGVALPKGSGDLTVSYAGPRDAIDVEPTLHSCAFDSGDLIIGGAAQRSCLLNLLEMAHSRIIILSTFLKTADFQELFDPIRAACRRGVSIDIFWGAEYDEETEQRTGAAAAEIMCLVRQDRDTNGRIIVHMKSTGSHAKLVLVDTAAGNWVACVSSCNWLKSPFRAVELSVILRDPMVVADVAVALQRMVGRRGLSDRIATEMALVARNLRTLTSTGGPARIAIVTGEMHDTLIREASGAAKSRFVVGSNKLGSTARPGALMPSEVAAGRSGVKATVLYTLASGPLKNRHTRALAEEAKANGVLLKKTGKIPLHGKVVAWDDNDLIITSLNWASASSDPDFPCGEIGVYIQSPGIAADALSRLGEIFPELNGELDTLGT